MRLQPTRECQQPRPRLGRFETAVHLLTVLLCTLLLIPRVGLAVGPVISLTSDATELTIGESASVSVQVSSISDLYGYTVILTYDPSFLELQPGPDGPAAGVGAIFGADAVTVINEETQAGQIEISATRSGAAQAAAVEGSLAALTFKTLKEGTAPVHLAQVQLANSSAAAIAGVTGEGSALELTASQPTTADVAVALSGATAQANPGSTISFTATVSNRGPLNATGVTLTETLPANLSDVSGVASQGACTVADGTMSCDLGAIARNGTATVAVTARPLLAAAGTTLTQSVRVSADQPDPKPDDNTASGSTTVNPAADLSVTKTAGAGTVNVGGTITYTMTAANAGPSDATGVRVTDTLPAGVTFTSAAIGQTDCAQADGTVTCPVGDLAAGASATATIRVVAPARSGTISASAAVSGVEFDPDQANNSATVSTTVQNPPPPPPADNGGTGTDNGGTQTDNDGTGTDNGGTGTDNDGTQTDNDGTQTDDDGTGTDDGGTGTDDGGTQTDDGGTKTPGPVVDLDQTAESTTSTDQTSGRAETTLNLTGDAATAAVQNAPSDATLRLSAPQNSDTTTLATTGSLIQAATSHKATLQVDAPQGSFQIPPGAIDLDALTKALSESSGTHVDPATVKIHVIIERPAAPAAQAATQAAGARGLATASAPVEFRVEARSDDKVVPMRTYGRYVTREVPMTLQVDPETATGAYFDGQNYHHVPTYFDANGKAVLHRNGDSLYIVVQRSRTFTDIAGHWAKADIESMASKLIVTGVTDETFNPGGNVTRAQFAILLARALGLEGEPVPAGAPSFTDVPSGSWFESGVRLAANYHLVSGYPDGSFHPEAPITRQELAVMVSRSMDLAGTTAGLSATDAQARIAKLSDGTGVANWAQSAVARAMDAGVITGYADGTFLPGNQASRAEAVVMIRRFLVAVHFINPAK